MSEISSNDWSETDASNNQSPPNGFPEGMMPSGVNDGARAIMGAVKRFWDRINGVYATGGSATAYTVTPSEPLGAYAQYETWMLRFHAANSGTNPTLNISSLGAIGLRKYSGGSKVDIEAGDIQAGRATPVWYDGTHFVAELGLPKASQAQAQAGTDNTGYMTALRTFEAFNAFLPTGVVLPYAPATPPDGWLLCAGQAVSRTTYAALWNAIGTFYGAGNGSTTFNLPDLRGRAVFGKDDMNSSAANRITAVASGIQGNVRGATGGAQTHELTTAEMPAHTHNMRTSFGVQGGGSFNTTNNSGGITNGASTSSTGAGDPHQNMPPTIILNYIIKAN